MFTLDMLETALFVLLLINALVIIPLIMIQQGRGASMGAAFGSGAANTMFGSTGSNSALVKLTTWLAIAFFGLTFGLAFVSSEQTNRGFTSGVPEVPIVTVPSSEHGNSDVPNAKPNNDIPVATDSASDASDIPVSIEPEPDTSDLEDQ